MTQASAAASEAGMVAGMHLQHRRISGRGVMPPALALIAAATLGFTQAPPPATASVAAGSASC
jgi:hypothetical protein